MLLTHLLRAVFTEGRGGAECSNRTAPAFYSHTCCGLSLRRSRVERAECSNRTAPACYSHTCCGLSLRRGRVERAECSNRIAPAFDSHTFAGCLYGGKSCSECSNRTAPAFYSSVLRAVFTEGRVERADCSNRTAPAFYSSVLRAVFTEGRLREQSVADRIAPACYSHTCCGLFLQELREKNRSCYSKEVRLRRRVIIRTAAATIMPHTKKNPFQSSCCVCN